MTAFYNALYLLLAAGYTSSFQTLSLSNIKYVKSYQLKQSRPPSVLHASIQEERKQTASIINHAVSGNEHHKEHRKQHHQNPTLIRIQGIDHHHSQNQVHHHHIEHQLHQTQLIDHLHTSTSLHPYQQQEKSHVLSVEEMNPIFQWTNSKGKTKVLNLFGVYNLLTIAITMPFWLLAMEILQRLGDSVEGFDENRAKFDYSGKIWCRTYLRLVDSYPEIAGDVSRLKDKESGGYVGACLFVANHASFLDIAVLCTVLDPVFKFIAKDSLVKFPGVGKQLVGVS
jgi:1-acyl-sn-glycerol-3-phosphate acyltransferase